MKKAILIIGGGELGLHQILAAREAGFCPVVTDRNPEAPGLQAADVAGVLDATDTEQLDTFLAEQKNTYDIGGVYCGNDFGLLAVEHAKQVLGLPHNGVEAAARCMDKKLMKECFIRDGVSAPRGQYASSSADASAAAGRLAFPLIVKPTDSSGSRGISVVRGEGELTAALAEAFAHTSAGVVLEEYIAGTHHDVNGFFFNNVFYPCGVMDRFFTPLPYCVPVKGYYPSLLTEARITQCQELLEQAARSMGVREGPVKGDLVISGDTIYIYEASARFHGDVSISHLYTLRGEKSPLERYFATLFSSSAAPSDMQGRGVAAWYALPSKRELKDTNGIPGFVWIEADSREEADRKFKENL